MPNKNGTAVLEEVRSLDDYQLDMRVSKMSGPLTVRVMRLQAKLKAAEKTENLDKMADLIDEVLSIARLRFVRKDRERITDEEAQWCLDNMPFEDLMDAFQGSVTEEAAVPPTNASNS